MKLNYKKIFMEERRAVSITEESPLLIAPEGFKHQPVLTEKTAKILVSNTKKILTKVYDGEPPELSVCTEAANIIIDEVGSKLDKIDCISQLRIFDEYTYSHTVNVSTMNAALGMILGFDEAKIKDLTLGGLLHDIGKMRVPLDILNKPAKLDPDEFSIMKTHTILGYRYIMDNLAVSEEVAKVALDHQEKYSGGGYPNNLQGKQISLYAQVTTIVDVFDALVSNRVYKKGMPPEKAVEIMLSENEKSFNPFMLQKFLTLVDYENKE
jgi:putative nucleotidyltransferase with HDIG domain